MAIRPSLGMELPSRRVVSGSSEEVTVGMLSGRVISSSSEEAAGGMCLRSGTRLAAPHEVIARGIRRAREEDVEPLQPLAIRQRREDVQTILNRWAEAEIPGEDRAEAKRRIEAFLTSDSTNLNLRALGLSNLPDIFDDESFRRLIMLDLSHNQLIVVPDSMGNLTTLIGLDLSNNRLRVIPDSMGNLTVLNILNLSNNQLIVVPDSMGNLTALNMLCLLGNPLTDLSNAMLRLGPHCVIYVEENSLPRSVLDRLSAAIQVDDYRGPRFNDGRGESPTAELPLGARRLQVTPRIREDVQTILNRWAEAVAPDENRAEAKRKIEAFLTSDSTNLDLIGLNLSSLPDIFNDEGFQRLASLYCSNNQLIDLPESMGRLTALTFLDLSDNQLRVLLDWIGNLAALRQLRLSDNQLAALPNSIGNLTELLFLSVDNNQLIDLPNEILHLGRYCETHIGVNPISGAVIDRLRAATQVDGYVGPRFRFDMAHANPHIEEEEEERPLQELLTEVFIRAEMLQMDLSHLLVDDQREIFQSWLNLLSWAADAQSVRNQHFYRSIVNILSLANSDEGFREVFWAVLQDASATCGDRVALSILHLGLARDIKNASDIRSLANILINGSMTLECLEEVSRTKIETLRPVVQSEDDMDQIEIYLGYPVMLKDRLHIPIDTAEMLYFRCSNITTEDLDAAATYVTERRSNIDTVAEYLMQRDQWVKLLRRSYGSQMSGYDREEVAINRDQSSTDEEIEARHIANRERLKRITIEALRANGFFPS